MAEPVYVVKPTWWAGFVLFGLPALFWPAVAIWWTWKQMTVDHPQLHTLLKLLPSIGEFALFSAVVYGFYKSTPAQMAGLVTAACFGIAYWIAAPLFGADHIWALGACALGGLLGYLTGYQLTKEVNGESAS